MWWLVLCSSLFSCFLRYLQIYLRPATVKVPLLLRFRRTTRTKRRRLREHITDHDSIVGMRARGDAERHPGKKVCYRACGSCCAKCQCVPPGTSGNTASCPCYANLRTHGNKLKCP